MEIKQMAERLNSVPVRKKAKQLLAVTLAVLMVSPVIGNGVAVHAQESEIVNDFAELTGEIVSQQLAVGAEESDIRLPDTLNVIIRIAATDENSAGDASVSGNDVAEPENEPNGAEDNTAVDSEAEPSGETTTGSAVHADTEDLGQEPSESTRSVTLEHIKWEIDAENSTSDTFNSSENGAYYTYVPVLPEGYTVADGVSLPEISVLIGSARMRTALGATEISIGDTVTIDGIDYTYQGDVSEAGLNLNTAPTEATYYKAGEGYALFTPANGGTPATLVLHGATISSADHHTLYLGAETVLKLEGTNRLTNTGTKNGVGIDNYSDGWQDTVIQGGSGDSLIVSAWTGIFAGNLTISGGNVTANGSAYGIITTGDMLIENGAQVSAARDAEGYALDVGNGDYDSPHNLTISGASSLTVSGEANLTGSLSIGSGTAVTVQADSIFWANCATSITNNGTIVNNGIFRLPYSYTAEQVKALNIPGTIQLYSSELDKYKIYANGEFYADGGDVSEAELDLTTVPTEATYYKAGDGYALFTPAGSGTPATLALTNATINVVGDDEAITLPGTAVAIELSGKNTLRSDGDDGISGANYCSPTITSSNGGTLDIEAEGYALNFEKSYGNPLTIGGNASVTAVSNNNIAVLVGGNLTVGGNASVTVISYKNIAVSVEGNLTVESGGKFAAKGVGVDVMVDGTFQAPNFNGSVVKADRTVTPATFDFTIYGTCEMPTIMASLPIGTSQIGIASLHIPSGAQMTIPSGYNMIVTDSTKLKLEGKLVNNGMLYLPVDTTANQIKALNLTGTGSVLVPDSIKADGMPSKDGKTYTNDGVALKVIGDDIIGLDLTTGDHSGKTVANDGYAWDSASKTLTLGNALISGDVTLPAAATINTTASTVIQGRIMGESGATMHLTFTGTAPLSINGGISAGSNGDTVTVQNGAQVTVNGYLSLGEGGDGVLTVTGSSTVMEVVSSLGYAVYCQNVKVENGATLSVKAEGTDSVGVQAVKPGGSVSVTGGSTLKAGCDYGVFIIDGKLTVDDTSKLITNGSIAPFCILDSTSSKAQGELLSLANTPSDTEIAFVKGNTDFSGSKHTYWSLIPKNGSLGVENEQPEIATLTGAKTGTLTFVKASIPGGNDNGGGGSSSGGSSSGGSSSNLITSEKKPDQPVIGSVNANGKVSDHHAVIIITDSMAKTAIEKAQSDAKAQGKTANGISAEVSASAPGAKSFTIITERAALDRLVSTNVKLFQIAGLPANICFDQASLKQQQAQGSGDITMTLKPVTVKNVRNAYDIALSTVKNGKTVNITSMGKGVATVSILYTPGKNEAVGGLYAVYVNANGSATRIAGSAYDTNSKSMIFAANHFSQYGIGYAAPAAKFTDIANHWAKESIDYVVGRGLLSGTSETAFSPNSAMTRGMLVTALGRLAEVDTKAYTKNSFNDVKADSAFRPYIEWAYKKGIVQGTGSGKFEPDRAVNREEIAAIFANYAKTTGYALPVTRSSVTYADTSSIGNAYKNDVKAMQQAGIMMGGTGNKFNPKVSATRAEVSSMLHRYIKLTINPSTAQGWAQNDAGQYLYYKDGIVAAGKWLEIGGKWYYFYVDGSLARSTKIDGYEVDKNGVRKTK